MFSVLHCTWKSTFFYIILMFSVSWFCNLSRHKRSRHFQTLIIFPWHQIGNSFTWSSRCYFFLSCLSVLHSIPPFSGRCLFFLLFFYLFNYSLFQSLFYENRNKNKDDLPMSMYSEYVSEKIVDTSEKTVFICVFSWLTNIKIKGKLGNVK